MTRHLISGFTILVIAFLIPTTHSFSQYVNIPDANFKAALLANSTLNFTPDGEIDSLEAALYTGDISVSSSGITDLTGIQCFPNITTLDFSQNSVTSVDLTHCNELNSLNCSFNLLTCLDLGQNHHLTYLNASNNNLLNLNVKNLNNSNVTYFNISSNSSLGCIQVDDVLYSTTNWLLIPLGSYFSLDCGTPVAGYTSTSTVCLGDSVAFTNTSTNGLNYTWNFGDGTYSSLANPYHAYSAPGAYTVTLTAQSGCYGADNYSANQYVFAANITGHVTYSGGDVTSGTVLLLEHEPYFTSYDTIAIAPLNATGGYTFNYPPGGDFIIKVYPDPVLYPDLIPTYKGNTWAWDSAEVLTHGCSVIDSADVYMFEAPPTSGAGYLSGVIIEGVGFGRSPNDPVHGVDVKLGITSSGLIVAHTETDTNGVYTFANVPYGNYTIYADIPGLHRDSSYHVIVDTTNSTYNNLDYFVDSNSVYVVERYVSVEDEPGTITHFGVFPNPATDHANVVYSIKDAANVQIEVINMMGVKMVTLVSEEQPAGEYIYNFNPKATGIQTGVYFLRLNTGNKSQTLRLMIIE